MTVIKFKNPIDPKIPSNVFVFDTVLDDKYKKNARKSRSKRERYAALCANNGICPIYHEPMKLWESHCDHIVPLAIGGIDDWENIISINAQVNDGKGQGKFPDGLKDKLLIQAAINKPKILALLDDRNFKVPHEVAIKVDLVKIHLDEIMADIGATAKWSISDIKYLIGEYLKRGVDYIYKIAEAIGKTYASCRSKLANLQIYDKQFQGQER
jgi:hypothetical protein|tara:strand:- start:372 stop:1007 length:636 start_codon:yes stop_codon:yes gene_type:complete